MADQLRTVGILGAGTMGAGIAQVAAMHGWVVELVDVDETTVRKAIESIRGRLNRLVQKERLTADEAESAAARLGVVTEQGCLHDCDILIEAIVEDLGAKTKLISSWLSALPDDSIIASNTSSLSVTALGDAIGVPERTLGMHFFNPAPLMKLVEIIPGAHTDAAVVEEATRIATSWGKVVARAADVPGFIVNHVARPYYLEAFRLLEDGVAAPDVIDATMKELGGFRMGPLELTDLIGQDVNTATTRSVWSQLDHPPLLHPSTLQERLVSNGHLGRKSGRGVYDYAGDSPVIAVDFEEMPLTMSDELRDAVNAFVTGAAGRTGDERQNLVFARILVALIAQAAHARSRGVAEAADIDTALKFGTNYPKGPFEWAQQIGYEKCEHLLRALGPGVDDGRFAIPTGFTSLTV